VSRALNLILLLLLIPTLTSYGSDELSLDYINVLNRLKSLGFREYGEAFRMKGNESNTLGVLFYKGSLRALLIYIQWDDGYSEAYAYIIYGDRIVLDSFSRAGEIKLSNELKSCFPMGCSVSELLEASCQDCVSNGCRPCCSSQISCPPGRYADCKFICSSWSTSCLINCGLTSAICASPCASCKKGSLADCVSCIACAIQVAGCLANCCTSFYCSCRCLRYH